MNHLRYIKIFEKRERIYVDSSKNREISDGETRIIYHTVRKKETASSIARKYGVSVKDVSSWNSLRKNRVAKGQKIKIKSKTRNQCTCTKRWHQEL